MKIATSKERIIQFIEYKGISKQHFFRETGLKRGFLDADKLQTSIPDVFIAIIIAKYPELNIEWLITGMGEMLKKSEKLSPDIHSDILQKEFLSQTLPLLTTEDMMNPVQAIADNRTSGSVFSLPHFADADFLFQVRGTAMFPRYNNGDIIVCKLSGKNSVIQWNRVYILLVGNREILVRRIQKGQEGKYFLLLSENVEYQSFEVETENVKPLAIVEGVLHFE